MSDNVEIFCTIEHTTDSAILIDDGDKLVWIPRSLIEEMDGDEEELGSAITISIPEWKALEEGLI